MINELDGSSFDWRQWKQMEKIQGVFVNIVTCASAQRSILISFEEIIDKNRSERFSSLQLN